MTGQAKVQLILELKNKLKTGLSKAKEKVNGTVKDMKGKLSSLKTHHIAMFSAMRSQIPMLDKGLVLISNRYVLMAGALVGVGLVLASATKKAANFNHEFLQIQNLNLDKSQAQLDKYKNSILNTAFAVGTEVKATSQAFYDVQSATGLYGKDAEAIVKSVGKFSIATGADLNETINSTTKAMKAFKLGVEDIDAYLESNAKTVQVGITTFAELARVQTEYGGAAAGAGQNVDTANKIFAAFTSIAKDSVTAATMTKTAFIGLTQKQTIDGLENMGINMYKANGEMKDLSSVLKDVSAKFKTMSPKAIDETINKIGGPEGLRNLFIKLKTGANDFFNTLESFDNSKFNIDLALKNAMGDFNTLKKIVGNRFSTVMTKLGMVILPVVAKVFNAINNTIVWLSDNLTTIKDVLGALAIGTAAWAATWVVLNAGTIAVTASYYGLVVVQKIAAVAQWALNIAMSANPIGILIGAIASLVAGLIIAYKKSDRFRAIILGVWASIKMLGSYIGDGFIATIKGAWNVIKSFFSNIWNGIKNVVGGIADSFGGLGKIIKSVLTLDWDGVKQGASKLKDGVVRAGKGMLDANPLTSVVKNYKQLGAEASKGFNESWNKNSKNRIGITDAYNKANTNSLLKSKKLLKADGSRDLEQLKKLKLLKADGSINKEKLIAFKHKKEDKTEELKNSSTEISTGPSSATSTDSASVSNVVGSAKQVKNIQIHIDAIHKGDMINNNKEGESTNVEEMGDKLNELILRTIRNVELSY